MVSSPWKLLFEAQPHEILTQNAKKGFWQPRGIPGRGVNEPSLGEPRLSELGLFIFGLGSSSSRAWLCCLSSAQQGLNRAQALRARLVYFWPRLELKSSLALLLELGSTRFESSSSSSRALSLSSIPLKKINTNKKTKRKAEKNGGLEELR
jgi:hypothetical protein